jgi:hypothetical protein
MINFQVYSLTATVDDLRRYWVLAQDKIHQNKAFENLTPEYVTQLKAVIERIQRMCWTHKLVSTGNRAVRITNHLSDKGNYTKIAMEIAYLIEALEDDTMKILVFKYADEKARLYVYRNEAWAPTLKSFPSVQYEVDEAIDCYAMEHNTAAVFHLMRVAEYGLRALCRERGVTFPKKPLEWATWQDMLGQIESKARGQWGGATPGHAKDAALSFYIGAIGQFHAFKDTYRNAVMHVRKQYDEHEAMRAINQVRDFMNGLSVKISEKTRSPIRRWP